MKTQSTFLMCKKSGNTVEPKPMEGGGYARY